MCAHHLHLRDVTAFAEYSHSARFLLTIAQVTRCSLHKAVIMSVERQVTPTELDLETTLAGPL